MIEPREPPRGPGRSDEEEQESNEDLVAERVEGGHADEKSSDAGSDGEAQVSGLIGGGGPPARHDGEAGGDAREQYDQSEPEVARLK